MAINMKIRPINIEMPRQSHMCLVDISTINLNEKTMILDTDTLWSNKFSLWRCLKTLPQKFLKDPQTLIFG
uniref:Uncharacterized protein n=1 Tax=Romanomermis culicivorax TaxID=13658 RepID=A0A915HVL3_ROMCU